MGEGGGTGGEGGAGVQVPPPPGWGCEHTAIGTFEYPIVIPLQMLHKWQPMYLVCTPDTLMANSEPLYRASLSHGIAGRVSGMIIYADQAYSMTH